MASIIGTSADELRERYRVGGRQRIDTRVLVDRFLPRLDYVRSPLLENKGVTDWLAGECGQGNDCPS